MRFSRLVATAAVILLASCQMSPDAMRAGQGLENSRPDAPRARTAQAIVLGQNNAIVVEELNEAQYQRHLSRLARKFRRQTEDTIYFATGETFLNAAARAALNQQAGWIRRHPEAYVAITGYADDSTSARRNKALGMERAREAVTYLVSRGVDRSQLVALTSGGTSSFRDGKPNRRVVTEILELKNRVADGGADRVDLAAAGDPVNGGVANGGVENGGATNGGSTNGGATNGGTTNGGTTNGGTNGGTGKINNGKKGDPPGRSR